MKYRKFRTTLLLLAGLLAAGWIVSYLSGIPVFYEIFERSRRVVESRLPVKPLAERAAESLDARLEKAGLKKGQPVFVRIFKEEAELEIWMDNGTRYAKLHTYPICRFSGFLGPKLKEGDRQSRKVSTPSLKGNSIRARFITAPSILVSPMPTTAPTGEPEPT